MDEIQIGQDDCYDRVAGYPVRIEAIGGGMITISFFGPAGGERLTRDVPRGEIETQRERNERLEAEQEEQHPRPKKPLEISLLMTKINASVVRLLRRQVRRRKSHKKTTYPERFHTRATFPMVIVT